MTLPANLNLDSVKGSLLYLLVRYSLTINHGRTYTTEIAVLHFTSQSTTHSWLKNLNQPWLDVSYQLLYSKINSKLGLNYIL